MIEGTVGGPHCFDISAVEEDMRRYAVRSSKNEAVKTAMESIAEIQLLFATKESSINSYIYTFRISNNWLHLNTMCAAPR